MTERTGMAWQILVVAYNSERELPGLIESIERTFPRGTSMAVWSNSDVARLRVSLGNRQSDSWLPVHVHGDGTNLGFAEACNRLAALSNSEVVMFLNPDTQIRELRDPVEPTESMLVAPLVYTQDGQLQRTFGPARTMRREVAMRLLRREPALVEPQHPEMTGFVSGAAFAVNRERFLRVGGFDPAYFMYYEDLDLCRRWRELGGEVWVDPGFKVMHIGGVSASRNLLLALQRSYESALTYHSRGHGSGSLFWAVALTEALLKSLLAGVAGRAGRVDRRVQWEFTKWLLRRPRRTP